MILDYYLPNQLFYCKFVYEMSPPKFRIDTSALFVVKCDVQWLCVWFKCENSATWFWSNSWQKQIFFTKNHTISSFPVKPGPSIILGYYQKKQSWRNDFIEAVHNGLKKIRMCIPIFYFLFFSRNDYDLLEDYAIWPIFIVTFEI